MYYYRGSFRKRGRHTRIIFFTSRRMKAHFMGESIPSRYGGVINRDTLKKTLFPAIAIDGKIVAEDRVASRYELERFITAQ